MTGRYQSYVDWAGSDGFNAIASRAWPLSETGSSFLQVEITQATPDPPTPDLLIQLCVTGRLDIAMDAAGRRFNGMIERGSLTVLPPDTSITLFGEGRAEFQVLAINMDHFAQQAGIDANSLVARLDRLFARPLYDPCLQRLMGGLSEDVSGSKEIGGMLMRATLIHIHQALLAKGDAMPMYHTGGLAAWQLRVVREMLHDRLAETVSLDMLAQAAGLSTFHFCRAFTRAIGISPHQYQIRLRIAAARRRLVESSDDVTQIALDVGYGSSQAFARVFRKEMSCSPSDYRRSRRR